MHQLSVFNCRLESIIIYVHDLLKIDGNSVSNVRIGFISSDLLRSSLFGFTCFGSFWFRLWLVSISGEGSLPEIALSGASKLASTYFSLLNRSVDVLYTEIGYDMKQRVNARDRVIWLKLGPLRSTLSNYTINLLR